MEQHTGLSVADMSAAPGTYVKPNRTGIGRFLTHILSQTDTSDKHIAIGAVSRIESAKIVRARKRNGGRRCRWGLLHHNRRCEPKDVPHARVGVKASIAHSFSSLTGKLPIVSDDLKIRIRCYCLSRYHSDMELRFRTHFSIPHPSSPSLVWQLCVLSVRNMLKIGYP